MREDLYVSPHSTFSLVAALAKQRVMPRTNAVESMISVGREHAANVKLGDGQDGGCGDEHYADHSRLQRVLAR